MKTETTLAREIRNYDGFSRYDAVCKNFFSHRPVLASILNSCLPEFKDYSIHDIAEKYIVSPSIISQVPLLPDETNRPTGIYGLNTEDVTLSEGNIRFDIRFNAIVPSTGKEIIINIEIQNNFYPGYPLLKRCVYYGSRLISSQYGITFEGSHYEGLEKVYTIWICLNASKEYGNTISTYDTNERCLVGKRQQKKEHYDLCSIFMICLCNQEDENYNGIIKLLDVLLTENKNIEQRLSILENEFHIPMTKELREEIEEMSNLGEGLVQKGIEIGEKRGIEIGKKQEKEQTTIAMIRSLMETTDWSIEKIFFCLQIPKEKYAEIMNALEISVSTS